MKKKDTINELTIKINYNGLDALVTADRNGMKTTKTVSMDELASSLASTHKLSTGIVPKGTRYYAGDSKNFVICLETAPRIKAIALDSRLRRQEAEDKGIKFAPELINIPFPACLFMFHIKNNKLSQTKVGALKQTIISERDQIYRFPFGNTHSSAFICWGDNTLPTIKVPMDVVVLMSLFLDSPFNGDLVDAQTFKKIKFNDVLINDMFALVRGIEKEARFPEMFLVELGQTFSNFVKVE